MERQYETALLEKSSGIRISWKKIGIIALMLAAICAPVFAEKVDYSSLAGGASGIGALDKFAQTFLDIFTSAWVEVICIIALVVIGIIGITGFQSGGGVQILKTIAPWAIGVIVIMSASAITNFLWEGAQ